MKRYWPFVLVLAVWLIIAAVPGPREFALSIFNPCPDTDSLGNVNFYRADAETGERIDWVGERYRRPILSSTGEVFLLGIYLGDPGLVFRVSDEN